MTKLNQEELLAIFHALKKIVAPFEKGTIKAKLDIEGKYDLWSEKEIEFLDRKRKEISFVTLIIQSSYVGFYYMPIYCFEKDLRPKLGEDLLKTLKGKACFHIKSTDKVLMKQIKEAMKLGYDGYKKMGWI